MTINGICRHSLYRSSSSISTSSGDEQIFLAMGALVRSDRCGQNFQRGTEKFLTFRVWVRRGSDFMWEFNEKIGIDRSAAAMDTSICTFEIPVLRQAARVRVICVKRPHI